MVIKKIIAMLILLFIIVGCDSKTKTDNSSSETNSSIITEKKVTKEKISTAEKKQNKETIQKDITFVLETIDGKSLHIKEIENGLEFKEFKGKAIFLVLFGHRCPPCLREIPELIELKKEHKDLEIVAIEVQGLDADSLQEFASDKNINYTLISGYNNMNFIGYIQSKASWGGSIPFLLGLDKKGKVKIMQVGGIPKKQLEIGYQELIKP